MVPTRHWLKALALHDACCPPDSARTRIMWAKKVGGRTRRSIEAGKHTPMHTEQAAALILFMRFQTALPPRHLCQAQPSCAPAAQCACARATPPQQRQTAPSLKAQALCATRTRMHTPVHPPGPSSFPARLPVRHHPLTLRAQAKACMGRSRPVAGIECSRPVLREGALHHRCGRVVQHRAQGRTGA